MFVQRLESTSHKAVDGSIFLLLRIWGAFVTSDSTIPRSNKVGDKLSSDYPPNRSRQFLQYFASMGLSSSLLPGVLWAKLHEEKAQKITREILRDAEEIAGLHFTDAQREMMLSGVNQNR